MSGYVSSGVPLSAVFGAIDDEREVALRTRLVAIDKTLQMLADEATRHVGQEFGHSGLQLFEEGRDISGGASADVGDIWFEISSPEPNRWEVSAFVPVHCDLMPLGYSCTHDLYDEQRVAESPEKAIEALAALVADVRDQLPKIPAARFHRFPHTEFLDDE